MLALAALLALQAGAPAAVAPAPTFCERMAQVWSMGSYKNTKGLVRRVQLKGRDRRWLSYTPDAALAETLEPKPGDFCGRARTGHALVCHVAGPGQVEIGTGRFTRSFPAKAGEHATVETDGRSIACQDRTTAAEYTRFEPLD